MYRIHVGGKDVYQLCAFEPFGSSEMMHAADSMEAGKQRAFGSLPSPPVKRKSTTLALGL